MTTSTRPNIGPPADDPVQLDRRLQAILEDTLVTSPNVQELHPSPLATYQSRLLATEPHIAELFHANSRLSRASTSNRALDPAQHAAVEEWFERTAYAPSSEDIDKGAAERLGVRRPIPSLPPPLRGLLGLAATSSALAGALYAVDLWALHGSDLCRYPVGGDAVWLERTLGEEDRQRLHAALLNLPPSAAAAGGALLLLVAAPWRYMLFQGPRGYRRCLVDAGRALAALHSLCRDLGLETAETIDFHDDLVDAVLDLDGIERMTIAALAVRPPEGRNDASR